jgi:type II secretory pathway pseudopilin PulG
MSLSESKNMGETPMRRKTSAFTLVELLVVIGIIALLIAILLPTLRKAQQAAQNAQCLSNLRQVGQAVTMYRADTGRIPFFWMLRTFADGPVPAGGSGSVIMWTSFSQGGKTTHNTIARGYINDDDKPLNKYLWKDATPGPWDGTRTPADKRDPRDVFRCPADPAEGGLNNQGIGGKLNYLGPSVPSIYELMGTSYQCNRGWMYDSEIMRLFNKTFATLPWTHEKVDYFNRGASKIVARWNQSETYVAADTLFLWSVFYHVQIPGAHSSGPWHNGVFLDGHAVPVYLGGRTVSDWGARLPGRYFPKWGEGWREARNYDASMQPPYVYGGSDPFGAGPRDQYPATKG